MPDNNIDRNIFIVNPAAGQGEANESFIATIKEAAANLDMDVEIHKTLGVGDATRFTSRILSETPETVRIFACGGDGTLSEVISGAAGHDNAIVGCIPLGTGNDFVRNFDDAGDFTCVKAQLLGREEIIDLMEYQGELDESSAAEASKVHGFSSNMFNIGFDCNVVDMAAKLKKLPLISGSLAYLMGVAVILIKNKGAELKIKIDGTDAHKGKLELITIANGCYCGGGVKSNPYARLDDGHFDVEIVKRISRIKFINLFPKYSKGTHLKMKNIEKIITYREARNISVRSEGGKPFRVSIDGEIISLDHLKVDISEKAMRFSVPKVLNSDGN